MWLLSLHGCSVGADDGARVGADELGAADGEDELGALDGVALGLDELGEAVGEELGLAEGLWLGLNVGDAVGDVLGVFDGEAEGESVGAGVGLAVGLAVGAPVLAVQVKSVPLKEPLCVAVWPDPSDTQPLEHHEAASHVHRNVFPCCWTQIPCWDP